MHLLLLFAIWLGTAEPEGLLDRIRQKMSENLARLPNYSCVQTVERRTEDIRDTLRMEVSFVGGRELFSWPGGESFDQKRLGEVVGGGMVSTGDFALHTKAVFQTRAPEFTYAGEAVEDGQRIVRYDFRVPLERSRYEIRAGGETGKAAYHGYFVVDATSLDLKRLAVYADEIPPKLRISAASSVLEYGRTPIGGSDFLLPRASTLVTTDQQGHTNRNHTTFSACRQFAGESSISFGDVPSTDAAPVKQVEPVLLPGNLSLSVRLTSPIDGSSAAGDPVSATVTRALRKGGVEIPKGAVLSGRITRLETQNTGGGEFQIVGIQFSRLEFANHRADFQGVLEELPSASDRYAILSTGINVNSPMRMRFVGAVGQPRSGEGIFFSAGSPLQIPAGFQMRWKTLP